jgi:hypothetical protein
MANSDKLTILRGDSADITVTLLDENDDPISLVDKVVFFTVKDPEKLSGDDDADAVIQKTISTFTTPLTGSFVLELSATDTDIEPRDYVYDLQVKNTVDDKVESTERGMLEIVQDITRRTE